MAPADILDRYYLGITALISLAIQATAFLISYTLQFDTITDFSGGSNFFLLALITLTIGNTYNSRNIIASLAVMLWAIRLGGFLLFRVLKTGGDHRFDEMRSHFFRFAGFWFFQLLWVWTVSLPVTIINSPVASLTAEVWPPYGSTSDIIGLVFFVLGFFIEAVADLQKFKFKNSRASKGAICDVGCWRWSRHPNYFSEFLIWWGIWLMTVQPALSNAVPSAARKALYASVLSPLFISFLLVFVSGLPTAEKPSQKRAYLRSHGPNASSPDAWDNMKQYRDHTSILLPMPPAVWTALPLWLKRTVLMDWGMFRFNEYSEGSQAIEEEQTLD